MTQEKTNQETPAKPEMALAPVQSTDVSIFGTGEKFEHYQRVAKALASSSLVPQEFRGNIPNTLIALDMADRLRANPLAVMQSIYIVHGKPSWSSPFIVAQVNTSPRFCPLQYVVSGDGDDRQCYAWAKLRSDGSRVEGPPVSIKMAKEEGWYNRKDKNGQYCSKWRTMPELMLRYRAATFFGRLYCPELLLGMQTTEEVVDVEGWEPKEPWKPEHGPRLFGPPKTPQFEDDGPSQPAKENAPEVPQKRKRGRSKKETAAEEKPESRQPAEAPAVDEEDHVPMDYPAPEEDPNPTLTAPPPKPDTSQMEYVQDEDGCWIRNPDYQGEVTS